jgi:hypothetical protein
MNESENSSPDEKGALLDDKSDVASFCDKFLENPTEFSSLDLPPPKGEQIVLMNASPPPPD